MSRRAASAVPRRAPFLAGVALFVVAQIGPPAHAGQAVDAAAVARMAAGAVVTVEVLVPVPHRSFESDQSPLVLSPSNGSGFFIDADGLVVTNTHVVAGATAIDVIAHDGSRHRAQLVGSDEVTDVALLRIAAGGWPTLSFADAPALAGEPIVSIGAPYGMRGSISTGIVSGTDRALRRSGPDWFLQHTAYVNPGSSGGPVIGMDGRVVGITAAIPDSQYEFNGLALAVDARTVGHAVADLLPDGRIERPLLGASFRALDMPLLAALSLTGDGGGVLVEQVDVAGPAARAGLKPDDRVLALNGTAVASLSALVRVLALLPSDRPIAMLAERAGATVMLEVTPGRSTAGEPVADYVRPPLGLTLEDGPVARVAAAEPGSLSDAAGLRPGDVIHSVGRVGVRDGAHARALLESNAGLIAVRISRGSQPSMMLVLGALQAKAGVLGGNNRGVLSARL